MRLDAQRADLLTNYNAKLEEKDNQLVIARHEEQMAKQSQKRLTQKLEDALEQVRREKAYKREVELGAKIACERLYFAIQGTHKNHNELSSLLDDVPKQAMPHKTMKTASGDTPKSLATTTTPSSDADSYSYSSDDDALETSEAKAKGATAELSRSTPSRHSTTKPQSGSSDE